MDMKSFLAQEVKPAFGCTEPGAVALAAAVAAREHTYAIEKIDIRMSVNVFKNGRSVGLPGLEGLRGNVLAAAIGALGGDADKGLMVLQGVSDDVVAKAEALVNDGKVSQAIAENVPPMWVEVTLSGEGHTAQCTLAHKHDRVEKITVDGKTTFEAPAVAAGNPDKLYEEIRRLNMADLWNFAMTIDDADVATLLEGARMNMTVAEAGMAKDWGLGAGIENSDPGLGARVRQAAAAASEVRMSGGDFPVMSSAGSGNHGITAIIPVVVAARELKADDKKLAQSLAISHLVCAFLKAHTGRLTPICGCAVAAGAGAAAGLVLMQNGSAGQAERAVGTFVASLVGMLCDGAKETCSLKVGSAAAEAWSAASLALHDGGVREEQGLAAPTISETGKILESLSQGVFKQLDNHMASIMLERSNAAPVQAR
ncbi:L-serine ammonia-lyase, iron-sulfur-dependent, subunit alpha [Desulfovibrio sp. OttesenSCG-928-O18]|nr:L-serine ammonia-lyase, iron-sulfur-dependent, subunit alpha [Desulfovibrio sp. OttesenSCG-928-O18]